MCMACHDWLDLIKHVNRVFLVIQHCSVRFKRLAEYFTLRNIIKMARPSPVQYNMSYRVSFETVIRGHHVYKLSWKLKINQYTTKKMKGPKPKNTTSTQSACTWHIQPDAENTLAGRVTIKLLHLLTFFNKLPSYKQMLTISLLQSYR